MLIMRRLSLLLVASLWAGALQGQGIQQTKGSFQDKFRQLDEVLPTANVYRNAAGAPGHAYWQQEVDYKIEAVLDEDNQRLSATELIRYQNNSPDTLTYLWFQLDQNRFRSDSMAEMSGTFNGSSPDADSNDAARISLGQLRALQYQSDANLGHQVNAVSDSRENELVHTVVGTLMRVDLLEPLRPGDDIGHAFGALKQVQDSTIIHVLLQNYKSYHLNIDPDEWKDTGFKRC